MKKLTLEELEKLQKEQNEIERNESKRIEIAISLEICPDCGGKLKSNIFQRLCDKVKCASCKHTFSSIDCDVTWP